MNYTVFKYTLEQTRFTTLKLPASAKVIHVGEQRGVYCLWVWLDDDAPKVERVFAIVGTGTPAPMPQTGQHVGTFISGAFVWHVFEKISA